MDRKEKKKSLGVIGEEIKEKIKEIESIFGEDVADLIYSLEEYNALNGWLYYSWNDEIIQVYFGDDDVMNVFVIFSKEPKKVRTFSNENGYNMIDLFDLLKMYVDE